MFYKRASLFMPQISTIASTHPFQDQLAEKDNNRCGLIGLRFLTFGRIFKVLGEFLSMGFLLGRFSPARYKANIFLPNQN